MVALAGRRGQVRRAGFSGYLLIRLAATMKVLGGDSMVLARGRPGLWACAAGSLVAFGTLFLPSPAPARPVNPPAGMRRLRAGAAGIRLAVTSRTGDLQSTDVRRALQVTLGMVCYSTLPCNCSPSLAALMVGASSAAVITPTAVTGSAVAFGEHGVRQVTQRPLKALVGDINGVLPGLDAVDGRPGRGHLLRDSLDPRRRPLRGQAIPRVFLIVTHPCRSRLSIGLP